MILFVIGFFSISKYDMMKLMLCNRYNYLLKVYPTQNMNYFSSNRSLLSPSRATIGSGRWRGSADDIPRTRGLIRRVFTRASRIIAKASQVQREETEESVSGADGWMNVCRCIERDQWTSSITLNPLVTADYRVRLTASLFNNQNRYSFSKSAIFPVQTQIQYRWFKCLLSPPPPAKVKDPIGVTSRASQPETRALRTS